MSETTNDALTQEREASIQQTVAAALPGAINAAAPYIIEQLQKMLPEKFFTPDDLKSIVQDVIKTTAPDNEARYDRLKQSQETWQAEQNTKLDAFIAEMRGRMDTFAPLEKVESLRTRLEDIYGHFQSITGGHGDTIQELQSRLKTLETSTHSSITSINASTRKIGLAAQAMNNTVNKLMENDETRQKALDKLKETAEERHAKVTGDIDAIQDDLRKQEIRVIKTELELRPISAAAGAVMRLFTTRRGNLLLAGMGLLFFSFQIINAFLTYEFIQRLPLLAAN